VLDWMAWPPPRRAAYRVPSDTSETRERLPLVTQDRRVKQTLQACVRMNTPASPQRGQGGAAGDEPAAYGAIGDSSRPASDTPGTPR